MNSRSESCDVLVVGGGTAGAVAAIQAARAGARVSLVEMKGQLGGTMTSGGVANPGYFFAWGRQVIAGIGWELVAKTKALDGSPMPDFLNPPVVNGQTRPSHYVPINRFLYAALAEEAALAAGVRLHYQETAVDVEDQTHGWLVTTSGKGLTRQIAAREIVDCTGDADVVGMLGLGRERGEDRQPGTLTFRLTGYDADALDALAVQERYEQALRAGALRLGDFNEIPGNSFMGFLRSHGTNAQHVPGADSTTSESQTRANTRGRASLLRLLRFVRTLPGCEDARLEWMCADTAMRETYRTVGETRITQSDYVSGRVFPDAICWTIFFIDLHTDLGGKSDLLQQGTVPTIPLSALVPRASRHLLAAGRCVSSDRLANSALRVQPSCMAMGQAAGAAAALAVRMGCASRDVPLDVLRALLEEHGAIVPRPGCE